MKLCFRCQISEIDCDLSVSITQNLQLCNVELLFFLKFVMVLKKETIELFLLSKDYAWYYIFPYCMHNIKLNTHLFENYFIL